MNKADYQMLSWICLVIAIVVFVGNVLIDVILRKVSTEMNASEFFWSYAFSWLLYGVSVILFVIGWAFHWRAGQEK